MTRRQLQQFLAVLEHGSLARAAAATGTAPASLAQSLTALERDVGAELVHRLPHGTVPTGAGVAFAPHARATLRALSADVVADPAGSERLRGDLDLVADPVLAVDPGAALLGRFRRAHPDVRVRFDVPDDAEEVPRHLADGRAEVALTYLPLDQPLDGPHRRRTEVLSLGSQELHLVLPPGAEDLPDPLALDRLGPCDVVDVPGSRWREVVRARVSGGGPSGGGWRVAVRTVHREAVVPLVLAGAGVAFTAGAACRWAAQQGAVVRRLDPPLRLEVGLVHHGPASPVVAALLRTARP
ncbi:LysR family transcriptional regulator [Kineococcus endophyticus]|uniref:LysR family transcriptional regulator n=1 Tax=Kineococcus endophyticus TaxID=1181883 RepID=A0ABV3PDC0_9ACTN